MNPIPLTARQIKTLDNIKADITAAETTLKIALNYHANVTTEHNKLMSEFWKELADLHDLDLQTIRYKIDHVDGMVVVALAEDDL